MISAWWLILIIPLTVSFGAAVMGVIAGGDIEEISAEACDNCHWVRYFTRDEVLERRCKRCAIRQARR
jgi:hypothetical protein